MRLVCQSFEWLNGKPNVSMDYPNADYPGQVGWSASNDFLWSINANRIGINQSNSRGIYSFHRGGANTGVADGAVRFLSNSTDFQTLACLIVEELTAEFPNEDLAEPESDERQFAMPLSLLKNSTRERRYRRRSSIKAITP